MTPQPRQVGRYLLFDEIASGGMGAVRLGRLLGAAGFSRVVVVKSLHAFGESGSEFKTMLLDEARLASRVRHPNVVPIVDVIEDGAIHLVMDYVEGESLSLLLRASPVAERRLAPPLALGLLHGVLSGLHAAHEARSERGTALGIVHRDVSPQNILVGADGTPRLIDFGVAKAQVRLTDTKDGILKGKIAYMAPEQLRSEPFDRRVDVYAASVVLWELLVGQRLFDSALETALLPILEGRVTPPKQLVPSLPGGLDAVVMKGLAVRPEQRFQSAAEMAEALEAYGPFATAREIRGYVQAHASEALARRAELVAHAEMVSAVDLPRPQDAPPAQEPSAPRVAPAVEATSATPPAAAPPAVPDAVPAAARVGEGPGAAREPRRGRVLAVIVALLGLGALAGWRFGLGPAPPPPAPAPATSRAVSPPVIASAGIGSEPVRPPPAAASMGPQQPEPSAAPSTSSTPAPPRPTSPGASRPPASTPAPTTNPCDPPFSLTSSGVKIPKPGCF